MNLEIIIVIYFFPCMKYEEDPRMRTKLAGFVPSAGKEVVLLIPQPEKSVFCASCSFILVAKKVLLDL